MEDTHFYAVTPIPELYAWFAAEAAATSPVWEEVCRFIASRPEMAALLDQLPGRKRQPNLFLGAIRYLGGPTEPGDPLVDWAHERWGEIERLILSRATQTNEPGRCAVLAPLLASLPQPIALMEVGASAGLCLIPDRYRYRYGDQAVVAGCEALADAPIMECEVAGVPPGAVEDLRVASRLGLDLNPLNAADVDDARWLRSLVWPGEETREARLVAALRVAAIAPPTVLRGSAPSDLGLLLDDLPGGTPVLMHSATLAYLPRRERDEVVATVRASGAHWLSFEGPTVISSLRNRVPDPGRPHFLVALDGEPVAVSSPHGGWVHWL